MDMEEVKRLLEKQGEAFAAFKSTHDEQMAELKGGTADPVLLERMSKIENALDTAAELKAAIDTGLAAEKAEREALEMKLNRFGLSGGGSEAETKAKVALAEFNATMASLAASRNKGFVPLDLDGLKTYRAVCEKYIREGDRALSADEVKVMSVGSDPDGGYFVTPDTGGRIVKKVYETSPMRQIAAQQTITTDALEGVEDLGEAGAGYAGEHAVSGDTTTPQVGQWRIPVFWIDTEPKATQQLLDDSAVDIEGWLAAKVGDKFSRFENAEFVTGAAGKIRGIAGYTTAATSDATRAWGVLEHVATGTSGAFPSSNPADKLYDLIGALKNAYLMNARFLTRRSVVTLIRKFKDGTGNYLWQPSFVLGVPETIMGYPVTRAEDIAAVAADSLSLAFGDFMEGYQIVDRQGIRVLRDPYTSKPYIKFYTTKRTGGGVLNFEAIKWLKFSAT